MPYSHIKDGGGVSFWTRKCRTCGKRWGLSAYFSHRLPEGMGWVPTRKIVLPGGETSYAKWGDRFPGVSLVASHLPAWPRWLRLLTTVIFVGIVVFIVTLFLRKY